MSILPPLQYTGSGGRGGGVSLASPGSCVRRFRPQMLVECHGASGECFSFRNKYSFWLAAAASWSTSSSADGAATAEAWRSPAARVLRGADREGAVSRCRVCIRMRNL